MYFSKTNTIKTIHYTVLAICLISTLIFIYFYLSPVSEEHIYETSSNDLEVLCEITKDAKVTQKIYLSKNIISFEVLLGNYVNRANSGKISFSLIQDEIISNIVINTKDIVSDNTYYPIPFDFSKFVDGEALIKIEGIDTEVGSSIALISTRDHNKNQVAFFNGKNTESSIVYKSGFQYMNQMNFYQFLLYILLSITISISFIKIYQKDKKYLVLLSASIIFLTYAVKYFFLIINPEPYAEVIINFYHNAKNLNFFDSIIIPDAGYLPLTQHIIAWILLKISNFGIDIFFLLNVFSLLFVSIVSSLWNTKYLDNFLPFQARFLISLIFPLYLLEDFENVVFLNFLYYGVFLLIFCLIIDVNRISRKQYVLLLLTVMGICLSKGAFVCFLPIALLCLVIRILKIKKRELFLICGIVFTLCIQLVYSFNSISHWVNKDSTGIFSSLQSFIQFIRNSILLYCKTFIGVFGIEIEKLNTIEIYIPGFIFVSATLFIPLILLKKAHITEKRLYILPLLSITSALVSSFNVITSLGEIGYTSIGRGRRDIFLIVLIACTGFVFISICKDYIFYYLNSSIRGFLLGTSFILCYCVISNSMIMLPSPKKSIPETMITTFSDWTNYKKIIEKQSFFIPIMPNGWSYQKNAKLFYLGYGESQLLGAEKIINYETNELVDAVSISTITELYGKNIVAVYINKENSMNTVADYEIVLKDINGNVMQKSIATSSPYKSFMGFIFDKPIQSISEIEFRSNNEKISVIPKIYIIIAVE